MEFVVCRKLKTTNYKLKTTKEAVFMDSLFCIKLIFNFCMDDVAVSFFY